MRNTVIILLSILIAFVACVREVPVTVLHNLSAEFLPDEVTVQKKVAYLNLSGGDLSAQEITDSIRALACDLLIARMPEKVEGTSCAEWVMENRSAWGHQVSSGVKSLTTYFIISAAGDADFKPLPLGDLNALRCSYGGYEFIVAAPTASALETLVEELRDQSGNKAVILALRMGAPSELLYRAGYTDCVAARYGDSAGPRTDYLYTYFGVWDRMSPVTIDPITFSIACRAGEE